MIKLCFIYKMENYATIHSYIFDKHLMIERGTVV